MKRGVRVFTWTRAVNGCTVRCVVATYSRNEAAHLAGLERIAASLEIGETVNPVLVRAALEKMGLVLYFDGEQYRALEASSTPQHTTGSAIQSTNPIAPHSGRKHSDPINTHH
jgi:hypothetical protein